MYLCAQYFTTFKGTGDMTTREVTVRVIRRDYFPDVQEPGDQETHFSTQYDLLPK